MYRHLLEAISPGVSVTDFGDPVQALLWSQKEQADLLLLDYRMPKMDGLEFARRFRRPLTQRDVPIVLITVVGDEPIRDAALEAGVIDFLVKPVRPRELRQRCQNLLDLRKHQISLKSRASALEQRVLTSMRDIDMREHDLLGALSAIYSRRLIGTEHRVKRLSQIAGVIASELGMDEDNLRQIEMATAMLDIGMIAVPDSILTKPGILDEGETSIVREHVSFGSALLASGRSDVSRLAAVISDSHHERWNGSGYPHGLKADAIPLEARIAAISDVYEALISSRPFRKAMGVDEAIHHIQSNSNKLFDPRLVNAFINQRGALETIAVNSYIHPSIDA